MINPQLEKVPDFVLSNSRKDLTDETYSILSNIIIKLKNIKGNNVGNAYNRIGVIQAFLNQYEEALYSFEYSLVQEFEVITYINYLTTLERLGKYKRAFDEGIQTLCANPNNLAIFEILFDISTKYMMNENFNYLKFYEPYLKFNEKKINIGEKLRKAEDTLNHDNKLLCANNINIEYYQLLINLAFCEVRKISHGDLVFSTKINDLGEVSKIIQCDLSINDLRVLNSSFDNKIDEYIDKGIISFDDYLYHMDKLFIGYEIKTKQEIVNEVSG